MGKPFWSKRGKDADQVEYALAPFPIGGYVQMLDEREGTVDPSEVHRAFNRQPVWKRFAIVAAGLCEFLISHLFVCIDVWHWSAGLSAPRNGSS